MEMNSLTSLKLRRAWMPPAVAQAPMVTRYFEARRTWWIRSASCGVVMDPSTSERSYGPFTFARDASRKLAISTSPATASSSSSQSSRLSWQPSQEANFQTASFGLCLRAISYLPLCEQPLHTAVLEDGPILADEVWPVLAVPTEADGTLHIALHRDVNTLCRYAALLKLRHREAHHDFGSANEGHGIAWIKRSPGDELRDDTDAAAPGARGMIYGDVHLQIIVGIYLPPRQGILSGGEVSFAIARLPAFEFAPVEDIRRRASAIEQRDLAVLFALCDDMVHGRAQWRQPDASGHNHHVLPLRVLDRPVTSKGSAHTYHIIRLELAHGLCHGSHSTSCMYQRFGLSRIAANRDRDLAHAEHVEHVELPGGKGRNAAAICRFKLQRERVGNLAPHALHPVDLRQHGITYVRGHMPPRVRTPYTSSSCSRVACSRCIMICATRFTSS